jgi:hypothetical protein
MLPICPYPWKVPWIQGSDIHLTTEPNLNGEEAMVLYT